MDILEEQYKTTKDEFTERQILLIRIEMSKISRRMMMGNQKIVDRLNSNIEVYTKQLEQLEKNQWEEQKIEDNIKN